MSEIDIDKVKKTFNWDPSKGDFPFKPPVDEKKSFLKNYKSILAIAISVILVFFLISYFKFM